MDRLIRRLRIPSPVRLTVLLVGIALVPILSCQRTPQPASPAADAQQRQSKSDVTTEEEIVAFCSGCHAMPKADSFPKSAWYDEVKRGFDFYHASNRKELIPPPVQSVVEYFRSRAPVALELIAEQASPGPANIRFRTQQILRAPSDAKETNLPSVSFVARWPMTGVTRQNILFHDMANGSVALVDPNVTAALPRILTRMNNPASATRCDLNGNGRPDLVVAELGSFKPEDHNRGKVIWLPDVDANQPTQPGIVIASGLGRVADVQPADFDADGDIDLVVAEFGWHKTGRILLLRNEGSLDSPKFVPQVIDSRPGAIHVPVVDLNKDGQPDFVALISQEFEVIEAFLNRGDGTFAKQTIYSADDPAFGSSGIQIVDMDGDGDDDVLYTNGDMFDSFLIKPYYGVQWLENKGTYPYTLHRLTALPGVLRALAGDLDHDGDIDIVAAAFVPASVRESDEAKQLDSVIWLEQSAPGRFVRHVIEKGSCIHAALELSDFDGDGDLDIATGAFRDRSTADDSAVTIWWNQLTQ